MSTRTLHLLGIKSISNAHPSPPLPLISMESQTNVHNPSSVGGESVTNWKMVNTFTAPMSDGTGIVEVYSKLALTFPSDKLVAISGLARQFPDMSDHSYYEYVADIFLCDLPEQVLWRCPSY